MRLPEPSTVAAAQWVRRTAAAFRQPTGVVQLWRDTAPAAARAAATATHRCTGAQPVFRPVEVAIFTDGPTGGGANPQPAATPNRRSIRPRGG